MKVSILSAIFPPEPIISARTSHSLAVGLVQKGHEVRVITNFPNRPAGKIHSGYKRSLYSSENDPAGFRITRCFSTFSQESSMTSRWFENITFGVTSSFALLFSKKPNAVYSNSWPIFATGLASLVCSMQKIPFIVTIQDLYPESLAIQNRVDPSQWMYKLLLSIDKWISKHTAGIIVLSEKHAMQYSQTRHVESSKIHVIPNWIDQDSISLVEKNEYRKESGITSDAFVFFYGGNIGKAAGVTIVIEAASKLNPDKEIALVIAGSGSELARCEKMASSIKNVRIRFHTPWEPEDTSKLLATADVLLLPTQGRQSLISIPSKLLSYMLSAKPILAMVLPESDTARVINDSESGWVIPPDDIDLLAEQMGVLVQTPAAELQVKGLNSRNYALEHFTTDKMLPKVIEVIEYATWESKISRP